MTNDLAAHLRIIANECEEQHGPDRWVNVTRQAAGRIQQLEAALQDIASGKYTGLILTSLPPKDPAVERAKAALGEKKDDSRS